MRALSLVSEKTSSNIEEISETETIHAMLRELHATGYTAKDEIGNFEFISSANNTYSLNRKAYEPVALTLGAASEALVLLEETQRSLKPKC